MIKRKLIVMLAALTATFFAACTLISKEKTVVVDDDNMGKKILFVVTNHATLGNTGNPTGYHLGEVTHVWSVLHEAGYEIDFVSPQGGKAPVTSLELDDPINKAFWEDSTYRRKVENTLKPSKVKAEDYSVIYYAGGHGAMWDFADNLLLNSLASQIYENNGIVSGVCHGPAGIADIKLSDGKYLVDGVKVNSFTNAEEIAIKLDSIVPFLLKDRLVKHGGIFEKSDLWEAHVVSDKRVITGQNPKSAKGVGEAILKELKLLEEKPE